MLSKHQVTLLPLWIASGLLPLWPVASLASLGVWLVLEWVNFRDCVLRQSLLSPIAIATVLCCPALIRGWSVWQCGTLWLTGVVVSAVLLLTDQRRQQLMASLSLAPLLSLPGLIWVDSRDVSSLALGWAATGLWAVAMTVIPPPLTVVSRRWLHGVAAVIGLGGAWWFGSFALHLGLLTGLIVLALQQRWGQRLWRICTQSSLRCLGLLVAGISYGLLWPFPTAALAPEPQSLLWQCAHTQIQHNTLNWLAGIGAQSVTTTCADLTGVTGTSLSGLLQLWAELGLLGLTAVLTLGFVTGDRYCQLLASSDLPRSQLSGGTAVFALLILMLPFEPDWLNSGLAALLLGISLAIPWTRTLPTRLPTTVDWLLLAALALQVNSPFWAAPLVWSWLVIRLIEQLSQRDWRGIGAWVMIALLFWPSLVWADPMADPAVTWSDYAVLGLGVLGASGLGPNRSLRLLRWLGLLPLIWLFVNFQSIDWTSRISLGALSINQVGVLTMVATVPALLLVWRDRSARIPYLISSLAGGAIILGTASRICLGSLILAMGLVSILNWQGRSRRLLLWVLPSVSLLVIGFVALRPTLAARYLIFNDPARLAISHCYTSQAWLKGPLSFWLGNGYGHAEQICQPPLILAPVSHAHNFVLQLLVDNGVLVLAVVSISLAGTFARLWQQVRSATKDYRQLLWQWLLISFVIGVVLHLFEGTFFKLPCFQLLIGLLLGLPWLGNLTDASKAPRVLPASSEL